VKPFDHSSSSSESAAAKWLARRDRGFSPEEQDTYLQWLRENPAHGAEVAFLERSWKRLDTLRQWHPGHSTRPNPDLLAPRRRRNWVWPCVLGAAAAVAVASIAWWSAETGNDNRDRIVIHPMPERRVLADGSLVELNANAKIDVNFSAESRNVRLVQGEAHFTVAKDANRPFVVAADKFNVRAVGTAFTVQMKPDAISVLVTEGNVQLNEVNLHGDARVTSRELSRLAAGQVAVVSTDAIDSSSAVREVREVTPDEIAQALAWQTMRLEFNNLPLRDVVAEFNRYNSRKLVIEDRETGNILVGGSFRADNVDPFVRLMELGFGVTSTSRGRDVVLRRRD
jgi:transmembrane sensor